MIEAIITVLSEAVIWTISKLGYLVWKGKMSPLLRDRVCAGCAGCVFYLEALA
jgi:hypothetical protein